MILAKLEDLPDEILIEICIYLNGVDVINAFGQLNSRLEKTIGQFRCDINLQYLTFNQFQRYCFHLLRYNAEYIVKLTLNTWYSPGEISLFHKSIAQCNTLRDFLPSLQQLWLINFSNQDVEILPKILFVEKLMIDIDTQMPLLHSSKVLLDRYLFCTPNKIKELRLYGAEDGIELQHDVAIMMCQWLEKLIISVATLDDLILIFRRAPNLNKLHIEVNILSVDLPKQYATIEMMLKHIKDFHLWIKDKRLLIFDDLCNILINMPTIERLSLEIETDDINFSEGYRWKELLSNLPNLSRLDLGLKIWIGWDSVPIDVSPYLETFIESNIDVCCYADSRVLFIDTIPYDFDSVTGIMTSPRASTAKPTNMKLFQQRARKVNTLCFDGRHELTSANDWLRVINRFPDLQVLDIASINVRDETECESAENYKQLRLPSLTILRYIRSTKCEVNIPFFMYLADNHTLAPRLRTLTIMYGDLIYLCKRLPIDVCFKRFTELCIYSNGADGHIRKEDTGLILNFFPNLEHFWLHAQSSRTLNRSVEFIAETLLCSLPKLISLRISCRKDSLRVPSFNDDDTCHSWIKRVCGIDNPEDIHIIVGKKELAIWK
ncbi:unnamed protein product [Rotaria magnacalcarata]|uniref:F-box domain-containing protein n=1 Tax=Rotaria magnacalcarata TaxID=392030 RepID=A0A815WK40_9BILA|nr:unnamed protein product [Rotaria magnacalcarata]CAF1546354.1 unnamed protein product [Rotaria magnacalcarata]CAF2037851.1 unnamed protein product [Rotaria magnacalcarata]CAF2093629.1 unnamed protein product [Rotaria magnacalcarata]CAF2115608.1 unnamed protein product [Rotaria magnacalcarata]